MERGVLMSGKAVEGLVGYLEFGVFGFIGDCVVVRNLHLNLCLRYYIVYDSSF